MSITRQQLRQINRRRSCTGKQGKRARRRRRVFAEEVVAAYRGGRLDQPQRQKQRPPAWIRELVNSDGTDAQDAAPPSARMQQILTGRKNDN